MFIRFYNQTVENIDKCIDEMRPFLIGLKEVKKDPISLSMNVNIPKETEILKNIQVTLLFYTVEDEKRAYQNKESFTIYQKYIIKDIVATLRKPGDMAVIH